MQKTQRKDQQKAVLEVKGGKTMALEHCFSIIKNKEKIEKVNIPDDFINYIKDSLFWIVSSWNGKTLKSGLPYYGEALISDEELVKFKTILEKWRGLFSLGIEEINLTGDFLIDEMKYEKVIYKKCELLNILDGLLQLCDKAECLKADILYEGI